jgi:hypothetical protein
MLANITSFDINEPHIRIDFILKDKKGIKRSGAAILDTGFQEQSFHINFCFILNLR